MTLSSPPPHRSKPAASKSERAASHPPGLLERAFPLEWSRPDWFALVPLFAAGLMLGVASFELLRPQSESPYRSLLLLGAVIGLGVFAYRFFGNKQEVLVGDAGVGVRQSGDVTRLLWWEISSIRYEEGSLVLRGVATTLSLKSACHSRAIREILAQAAERLPNIVDVKAKLVDELPPVAGGSEPPFVPVSSLQIAGKRCAVSKSVIAIERDARVCPNCTSVYHRDRLPKICVTCHFELGKSAVAP